MRERRRSPWYLLTGLIIGALIGILYGWGLAPVQYIETSPASLREDFKQEYMVQIALAYAATGDPARAQARLALVNEDDLPSQVAALAQRGLAAGRPETEVRALGLLAALAETMSSQVPGEETTQPTMEPTASATSTETNTPQPTDTPTATLQPSATPTIPPPTATFTESQATQVTTETSAPTPTQTPTPTPTATPGLPYILDSQELICDPNYQQPLLIVRIQDAAGNGVPGVHIIVSHTGGEDNFFTGLKPELGLDYADYVMQPSIQYTLRLQDGSQRITGLEVQTCTGEDDAAFWGSWELIFVQPR